MGVKTVRGRSETGTGTKIVVDVVVNQGHLKQKGDHHHLVLLSKQSLDPVLWMEMGCQALPLSHCVLPSEASYLRLAQSLVLIRMYLFTVQATIIHHIQWTLACSGEAEVRVAP